MREPGAAGIRCPKAQLGRLLARAEGAVARSPSPHKAEAGVLGRARPIEQAGEVRSSAVESLRALAALAVLEGHVFGQVHDYGSGAYASVVDRGLLGGGFGVYLFFALTGYLLYRPFARRDFGAGRSLSYGRYAANRAFRILPLYYVVLVTYLLVFDHSGGATTWWRSVLFLENFFPQTLDHIDGVMWSLVVEAQFYLLLPFLAAGLRKMAGGSARTAAFGIAAVAVVSELIRLATVTLVSSGDERWEYSLPATFVFFTSGMLLALVHTNWGELRPQWLRGHLARGTLWMTSGVGLWCVVAWRYDLDVLLVPAGFLVLGAATLPLERGWGVRLLEWRPLATLGLASYSLYLWHFPILEHLGLGSWMDHHYLPLLVVMVPLCCAVALVSYAVVEAPFLRLRRSWSYGAGPRRGVGEPVSANAEPA